MCIQQQVNFVISKSTISQHTSPLEPCVYYRVYRKKAAKSLGVCQGGIATRSTSMG